MRILGKLRAFGILLTLAVASAVGLSACGGSSEPQGKVKPVGYSSPEEEAKLKAMAAANPKMEPPKIEDPKKKKKGSTKGGFPVKK